MGKIAGALAAQIKVLLKSTYDHCVLYHHTHSLKKNTVLFKNILDEAKTSLLLLTLNLESMSF